MIVIALVLGFEVYGVGGAYYGAALAVFGVAALDAVGRAAARPTPSALRRLRDDRGAVGLDRHLAVEPGHGHLDVHDAVLALVEHDVEADGVHEQPPEQQQVGEHARTRRRSSRRAPSSTRPAGR